MFYTFRKFLNIFAMFLLVISAISCGIWGVFRIEILPALMGESLSRILYCTIGVFSIYGTHLFIEFAKAQLSAIQKAPSNNPSGEEVHQERSYEE